MHNTHIIHRKNSPSIEHIHKDILLHIYRQQKPKEKKTFQKKKYKIKHFTNQEDAIELLSLSS